MKIRMVNMNLDQPTNYYDYRVELTESTREERQQVAEWLREQGFPYTLSGRWPCDVVWLKSRGADLFALKWQS
jgi:intein/homing endonuclease